VATIGRERYHHGISELICMTCFLDFRLMCLERGGLFLFLSLYHFVPAYAFIYVSLRPACLTGCPLRYPHPLLLPSTTLSSHLLNGQLMYIVYSLLLLLASLLPSNQGVRLYKWMEYGFECFVIQDVCAGDLGLQFINLKLIFYIVNSAKNSCRVGLGQSRLITLNVSRVVCTSKLRYVQGQCRS